MRRIDLRLSGHADGFEDGHQLLAKSFECLLGLPHVDNTEPIRSLSRHMNEQALHRAVSRLLDASTAAGESANRFLVLCLGESR